MAVALLHAGANPNARDNDQETVLMWASAEGQTEIVERLIKAGADVNAVSPESGYTPLVWAAQYGRAETVRCLLSHSAVVDALDDWDQTALAKALAGKHHETLQLLLEAGAQITPTTGMLMAAAYGGFPEIVARLIELGVDVNAVDETGATALKWASESGSGKVVQILKRAAAQE